MSTLTLSYHLTNLEKTFDLWRIFFPLISDFRTSLNPKTQSSLTVYFNKAHKHNLLLVALMEYELACRLDIWHQRSIIGTQCNSWSLQAVKADKSSEVQLVNSSIAQHDSLIKFQALKIRVACIRLVIKCSSCKMRLQVCILQWLVVTTPDISARVRYRIDHLS